MPGPNDFSDGVPRKEDGSIDYAAIDAMTEQDKQRHPMELLTEAEVRLVRDVMGRALDEAFKQSGEELDPWTRQRVLQDPIVIIEDDQD